MGVATFSSIGAEGRVPVYSENFAYLKQTVYESFSHMPDQISVLRRSFSYPGLIAMDECFHYLPTTESVYRVTICVLVKSR